jgi:polygalacturonase
MAQTNSRRSFLKTVVFGASATAVVGLADCGGNAPASPSLSEHVYDVTDYGATGNGATLDTNAINSAIQAAAAAGGGTVLFPAGNYLSYSIHLASNVTLQLEQGATIIGADVATDGGPGYDPPEPGGPWTQYQDSLHNFYHNSLIWGVGLENVSILGPGLIWGRGLITGLNGGMQQPGTGNKAIALKECRNVLLQSFSVLKGGGDAIKALGTDQLTIDNLVVDTNRGGIDVDCCQHAMITDCTVNSPQDDGICLKSSYALGYARVTSDVTISNCAVSGSYVEGTVIDGTRQRLPDSDPHPRTGRIKLGTESNGGFQNITISDCSFDGCCGLLLASVDGALIEDVHVSNLTMTDLYDCPVFIRLGARLRGPKGTTVGAIRRVIIDNISASGTRIGSPLNDYLVSSVVAGIPGHPIEDVTLSNIAVQHAGTGTKADGSLDPPEVINQYPEVTMFGTTPSHALFVRHVGKLTLTNAQIQAIAEDDREAFYLKDVQQADFVAVQTPHLQGVPTFVLEMAESFSLSASPPLPDTNLTDVEYTTI